MVRVNKKLVALSAAILLLFPVVILALNIPPTPGDGINIINAIDVIIYGLMWPIFGGFAVVMFIYAGFLFLTAQGEPSKLSSARNAIIWGVVGVAVGLLSSSIPWIVQSILGG